MRVTSAAIAVLAIVGLGGCAQGLPSSSVLGQSAGPGELFSGVVGEGGGSQRGGASTAAASQRPGPMQAEIYDGGGVAVASTAGRADGAANAGRDDQSRANVSAGAGGRIFPVAAVGGDLEVLKSNGSRAGEGARRNAGDGINLNFENAEIKTVARAILGDVLNLNYAIDPRVSGTISLSTQRPVPRKHVLSLLETALRAQGAAIVQQEGVYRIVPDQEAVGISGANVGRDAGGDGHAITALPLENISADALLKILDGFGTRPRSVRVDAERNMLIVQGTYAERQSLIDTALAFDVDWMRNQSVGIFPIQNANPDTVITELNRMVDKNVVRFQPIGRMNAILAVSKSPQAIRQVSTWIGRLDRMNEAGARVRVIPLKYADARRITALIKEIFGAGGSGQASSAAVEVSPGTGAVTARVAALPNGGSGRDLSQAGMRGDAGEPGMDGEGAGGAGEPASGDTMLASGRLRITADLANNAVVVFSTQEQAKLIEQAIRDLDRAPVQVAIEATIAEISLNDDLRNGLQFYLTSKKNKGSVANLLDVLPLERVVPGLNLLLGSEASPKLVLDALREVTKVKILSSPSLVVVNNQPAILQVGDQVPVTTRSAQDVTNPTAPVVNSIDFRDTGVILRVTPRVHANSTIGIDIEQEISAVKEADTATLTPTISQRRVKSSVSVADAQTLLIGGLISEQRNKKKSGIPGIVDVPVLGEIFSGSNVDENTRTELIIFIRPQLIHDTADARRVADSLRQRMKGFERW
jgi:general secretion pathway protein D